MALLLRPTALRLRRPRHAVASVRLGGAALTRRALIVAVVTLALACTVSSAGAVTIEADVASPLAISPDPIDFGNVRIGQSTTRTATVTNNDTVGQRRLPFWPQPTRRSGPRSRWTRTGAPA
jgi:hypothetical protein